MNKYLNKITGPVIPLPIPFTECEEVDYVALESYVKWLVDNGIKNVMTTVGTSRYNLMTPDEAMKANETVVKAAAGKAISIVANPQFGGTKHAIEFAKHSESIGADIFLAYFPERHYGEENTYDYFKELSDSVSNIGILIHEMPMRNGFGGPQQQYSLELIDRILDLENVIGMKEEALDAEYSNQIVEKFSEKAVIIGAGGGMSRYLARDFERGAKAYLGGIGGFAPQVELEFFDAMITGNTVEAEEIVKSIEKPYFDVVVPMGWHPSLKAALSVKGLMPKFERKPMRVMPDSEYDQIREIMNNNGWL